MSDEGSDVEDSCGCVPNSIIPRTSLFSRRECERNNVPTPDGWMRFGTVKHLLIYPVDHGTGFQSESFICTSDGPEFDSQDPRVRDIQDRRLVVYQYSPNNLEICLNPEINIINCTLNQLSYGNINDFANDQPASIDIEKTYHGRQIFIQRRRDLLENQNFRKLYSTKEHRLNRVGYFSAQRKSVLISANRFTHQNPNIDGLLPSFSHFTLINNKSLQCLKSDFQKYMKENRIHGDARQISYLNFFPHIVIDGDSCSEFQENLVTRVKIGNIEFGEILPCVHNDNINFNRTNPRRFQHLHEYLSKTRPLSKVLAEVDLENQDMPVFGINMEKLDLDLPPDDDSNRIRKNDAVYVQF